MTLLIKRTRPRHGNGNFALLMTPIPRVHGRAHPLLILRRPRGLHSRLSRCSIY